MTMTNEEKEKIIKREKSRLRKIFKDLDPNKFKTIEGLIDTAAFLRGSLADLETTLNADGFFEDYDNGGGQKGKKQSEAFKAHVQFTKNYVSIARTLADLAPAGKKKETRLQALRDEK
jgi:hypothetical protein